MSALLLCRSLIGRLPRPVELAVVVQVGTVSDLLSWFAACRDGDQSTTRQLPQPRVRLRPIDEQDLPGIYRRWCDSDTGAAWIARGSTPSWQEFPNALWSGVDSAFIGEELTHANSVALVVSYGYDANSLCVFVGVLALGERDDVALGTESILELIRKLFNDRPVRRVILEVPEYNWWLVDGIVDPGPIATLKLHQFHRGQWWDVALVPIDRTGFSELIAVDAVSSGELLRMADGPVGH